MVKKFFNDRLYIYWNYGEEGIYGIGWLSNHFGLSFSYFTKSLEL